MSIWTDIELDNEFEFLPLDNIGTPTFFTVKNWDDINEYTFTNEEGNKFTRNYLTTSEGLLAISSKRLRIQLKKFALKKEKRTLTIQRWCEGKDTRSTVFKVELQKVVTSTKK